jgi:hypothetical protein
MQIKLNALERQYLIERLLENKEQAIINGDEGELELAIVTAVLEKLGASMSNMAKAIALQKAVEMLGEVDALVQATLGATDECYDVHIALNDIGDTLYGFAEQLEEMQITD